MDLHLNDPLVSVVMPVYNTERYVGKTIESILNQTYKNFEFIIINDGSTDNTHAIISTFNDSRIIYISNPENLHIVKSRNIGCRQAKGKYIATMDADDISFPKRFEKQVEYLESHEKCGVLGTSAIVINEAGREEGYIIRQSDNEIIKWEFLFACQLSNPTVMLRRELLDQVGYYHLHESEDLDLWERLLHITDFANLTECLHYYRIHTSSFSIQNPLTQKTDANKIFKRYQESVLKRELSDSSSALINAFFRNMEFYSLSEFKEAVALSTELYNSYIKKVNNNKIKEAFATLLFSFAKKYKGLDSKYCTELLIRSFRLYPALFFKLHTYSKLIKYFMK
jgi:glycosyltransferase involved in cell wall biosynthesis